MLEMFAKSSKKNFLFCSTRFGYRQRPSHFTRFTLPMPFVTFVMELDLAVEGFYQF